MLVRQPLCRHDGRCVTESHTVPQSCRGHFFCLSCQGAGDRPRQRRVQLAADAVAQPRFERRAQHQDGGDQERRSGNSRHEQQAGQRREEDTDARGELLGRSVDRLGAEAQRIGQASRQGREGVRRGEPKPRTAKSTASSSRITHAQGAPSRAAATTMPTTSAATMRATRSFLLSPEMGHAWNTTTSFGDVTSIRGDS